MRRRRRWARGWRSSGALVVRDQIYMPKVQKSDMGLTAAPLRNSTATDAAAASATSPIPESRSPVAASGRHAHANGGGEGDNGSGGEHGLWVLNIDAATLRDFVSCYLV